MADTFLPPLKLSNWRNAITTAFGAIAALGGERHYGIDVAAPEGTPVYAPTDGKVAYDLNEGGGNTLILTSGNMQNVFAHLQKFAVPPGVQVKQGDLIGYVGHTGKLVTGNHLHWEVKVNGTPVNPLDLFDPTKAVDLSKYAEAAKAPWETAGDIVGGLGDFLFGGGLVQFLINLFVLVAGSVLVLIGGFMVWNAA